MRRRHGKSKDPVLASGTIQKLRNYIHNRMYIFRKSYLSLKMTTHSAEKELDYLGSLARCQHDESKSSALIFKRIRYFRKYLRCKTYRFKKLKISSMNIHSAEKKTDPLKLLARRQHDELEIPASVEKFSFSSSKLSNSVPSRVVLVDTPCSTEREEKLMPKPEIVYEKETPVLITNTPRKAPDSYPKTLVVPDLYFRNCLSSRRVHVEKPSSKKAIDSIDSCVQITKSNKVVSQEPSLPKESIQTIMISDHTFFPGKYGEKKLDRTRRIPVFAQERVRNVPIPWRWVNFVSSHCQDVDWPRASVDNFCLTWTKTYAEMEMMKWSPTAKPWSSGDISNPNWERLITLDMDDKAIIQAWSKLPVMLLDETLRDFMLWALQNSPERALKVLEVAILYGTPKPPGYVLGDCIYFLADYYLRELKPLDSEKLDRMLRLTCNFIQSSGFSERKNPLLVDPRTPYLIVKCCGNDQAQNFWDFLVQNNVDLPFQNILQFLAKFTEMADLSRSMEALHKVVQTGVKLTSLDVQYGCAKLLRGRFDGETQFSTGTYIWNQLLRLGIPPSIYTYNSMIHNCVKAGEYDTAITWYNRARENPIWPDLYTYHWLLEVFKQGSSLDVLDLVLHDAEADGTLPKSEHLICKILSSGIRLDFPKLLRLYGRYYNPEPLYDIGVLQPGELLCDPVNTSRYPVPRAVGIILAAYIRQNPTSGEVIDLHRRYCALVHERNPYALAIAQTDYVSNAFIYAFGQRSETVELCIAVIGAMLRPSIGDGDGSGSVRRPTVISWTLLLQAYCRNGQMLAAEKVMSMMREREVIPNRITWNVLVFGHAAAQDIDGALGAVKRMEAAGFPVEEDIVRCLGMYRDREKMLQALEDATETILEESRWEPPTEQEAPHPIAVGAC